MSLSQVKDILMEIYRMGIMPYVIAVFSFLLVVTASAVIKPKEAIMKSYQRINEKLIEKKQFSFFDYEKIQGELRRNGVLFRFPQLQEPIIYIACKVCSALLIASLVGHFHIVLFFVGFALGYKVLDLICILINRNDNNAMHEDIQFIYNSLGTLVRSGVYVSDALCECYAMVNNPRLKSALLELTGELLVNTELRTVIIHFQGKFNNQYINSLCVTILQFTESGMALDLLSDISEQIKNFRAIKYEAKKEQMDRHMTYCILVLAADIMVFIAYMCASSLKERLSMFF